MRRRSASPSLRRMPLPLPRARPGGRPRRRAAATVAAAALLAAAPAGARAADAPPPAAPVRATFDLTYRGTVSYDMHEDYGEGKGRTSSFALPLTVRVPRLTFVDGRLAGPGGYSTDILVGLPVTAARTTRFEDDVETCRPTGAVTTAGASLVLDPAAPLAQPLFLPFMGLEISLSCRMDSGGAPSLSSITISNPAPSDRPRDDGTREAPSFADRLDAGNAFAEVARYVESAENAASPVECPRTPWTTTCTATVQGLMTFERTSGGPPPGPPPADDDDDEPDEPAPDRPRRVVRAPRRAAPPRVRGVRIERGRAAARVRFVCSGGCRGSVTARPGRGHGRGGSGGRRSVPLARGSAAAAVLARRAFSFPAGGAVREVAVRFDAADRRALAAAGSLELVVALDPPRGATVRRTVEVPLPRR